MKNEHSKSMRRLRGVSRVVEKKKKLMEGKERREPREDIDGNKKTGEVEPHVRKE